MMSASLELLRELIARPSLTPEDAGCQELIANRLQSSGFAAVPLRFADTSNLWLSRGTEKPLLVFAGHTDVVPPGDEQQWLFPPFQPTMHEGMLYGRGVADMKGGLAAMVTAIERFLENYPQHRGTIAMLLTSDEEGSATHGTCKVMEWLAEQGISIDWCLLGEPSSDTILADQIRIGRRGSLSGYLQISGKQGHVAYPELVINPAHTSLSALEKLVNECWDSGSNDFPPTSFQIVAIHAGGGADNVTPGELEVRFNFRFSNEVTAGMLQQRVEAILSAAGLDYSLEWNLSGEPFLSAPGALRTAVLHSISEQCGIVPVLSTGGGTSDGRFIAPTGTEVIELGLRNATIHQVNECIAVQDLHSLSSIYEKILLQLLG